jgi:hypothetical protein
MTIPTTSITSNRIVKQQSTSAKSSKRKRNTRPTPLLPQVVGIRQNSDGNIELVIKGGSIGIAGEFWTTEKLADELFDCLIRKEAEPDLVTICSANDEDDNNNNCSKKVDLSEKYESSNTLLYRKYIIRAEKIAGAYSKDKPIIFVINLVDLPERLQAELIDLQTANSERTLSYVLHSAVGRIFATASLNWFYESVSESHEIKLVLQP